MKTFECPCCGHKKSTPVPIADLNELGYGPVGGRIMSKLINANGRAVRIEDLIDWVYANDASGGPDDAMRSVKVILTRLRNRLAKHGWTIPKNTAQTLGIYRLEPLEAHK